MFKKIEIKPIHFIAAILVLLLLMLMQCNRVSKLKQENVALENKVERIKGNVEASVDTVEVFTNDNGFYISEIKGYQFTVKELKKENVELLDKYKDALEDALKLERLNQLLQAQINIKDVDTVWAIVKNDTTLIFSDSTFYEDDNWRKFTATVDVSLNDTVIKGAIGTFDYDQNIKLYAGIETVDGIKKVNISTKYPGITFKNIEGISIVEDELNKIKKQKRGRLSLGVGGGYGITFGNSNTIYHGPQVGLFLTYSPKWLQF
jgi:hypothetical protein